MSKRGARPSNEEIEKAYLEEYGHGARADDLESDNEDED